MNVDKNNGFQRRIRRSNDWLSVQAQRARYWRSLIAAPMFSRIERYWQVSVCTNEISCASHINPA